MKNLLIAVNSKYIHSSLAVWYLKGSCRNSNEEIKVLEFTINDDPERILLEIAQEKPETVAFSCYIWNISFVLRVTDNLKKINESIKIVLGGPEVSYDTEQLMQAYPSIDYTIIGEGETIYSRLLGRINSPETNFKDIKGLAFRQGSKIIINETAPFIENLDTISSPYTDEMLHSLSDRIVYFESSRGCPFSCSYCLSSTNEGVRYFSMERVKNDLNKLISIGAKQVKFVDRTFNCNKIRAKEIINYVINKALEADGKIRTNFHFEAAADLFDNEIIDILSKAPSGLIQLEIGVQTTNPMALELVERKTNLQKVFSNVRALSQNGNINLHLDLIAGLPAEDYESFKNSFNQVYELKPHQFQLGFLKMLKGSKMREHSKQHGYQFRDYPPYEVLFNKYINFDEILELKRVEDLVEKYYNSGRFKTSLSYIIDNYFDSAYEFYHELAQFFLEKGYWGRGFSSRELYTVLINFLVCKNCNTKLEIVTDLMKLDYLCSDKSNNLPLGLERVYKEGFKECCFEFLKNTYNIEKYLPEFQGITPKQIYKEVHFELFDQDILSSGFNPEPSVVLFSYKEKDKVTGLYKYMKCLTI